MKGKGKGKGEHQDPNAGWKNPMQVYTATPKEKQDTNTINQLRASSREQNSKMKELNEKLKRYEEKHGKLECKYSSDHSDSETDDDHFWKLQSPAEDTSLQESSKTKVQTHTMQIGAINTKTDIIFMSMPIRIQINSASISLNPESTIGWDSYAGLSVSCVKSNFLSLIKDGPLLQDPMVAPTWGMLV